MPRSTSRASTTNYTRRTSPGTVRVNAVTRQIHRIIVVMGIRQMIDTFRHVPDHVAAGAAPPVGLASPFSPSGVSAGLESVVWADVMGTEHLPLTRAEAMKSPAVIRARGLIVTTLASCGLLFRDGNGEVDPPVWAGRTDGPQSPYHRMLWTADDLLFYGWAAWAVDRDTRGNVIAAAHLRRDQWSVDERGRVIVNDQPVRTDSIAIFEGVHEGVLTIGATAIGHARALARAAETAAENPAAYLELHQTSGAPLTDEQIDRLIDRWAAARKGKHGGVAFTNASVEINEHGTFSEHLLIEGRNAAAVDVARVMGVPSTSIDAPLSGSSLSYSNTATRMAELVAFGVAPLMQAIAARLGMDDLSPRGTATDFDVAALMDSPVMRVAVPDDAPPVVDTRQPRRPPTNRSTRQNANPSYGEPTNKTQLTNGVTR